MTPDEYRTERKRRGTQACVAKELEVSRVTVARREAGVIIITKEAELAIRQLKLRKP